MDEKRGRVARVWVCIINLKIKLYNKLKQCLRTKNQSTFAAKLNKARDINKGKHVAFLCLFCYNWQLHWCEWKVCLCVKEFVWTVNARFRYCRWSVGNLFGFGKWDRKKLALWLPRLGSVGHLFSFTKKRIDEAVSKFEQVTS